MNSVPAIAIQSLLLSNYGLQKYQFFRQTEFDIQNAISLLFQVKKLMKTIAVMSLHQNITNLAKKSCKKLHKINCVLKKVRFEAQFLKTKQQRSAT